MIMATTLSPNQGHLQLMIQQYGVTSVSVLVTMPAGCVKRPPMCPVPGCCLVVACRACRVGPEVLETSRVCVAFFVRGGGVRTYRYFYYTYTASAFRDLYNIT